MWDNGVKNIKLYHPEFIDRALLSRDSRFNMETHTVRRV